MQRGLVESFNGRLRDECLSEHLFANLNVSRQIIEEWKIDYNTNRPPSSLNGFTPTEFATRPTRKFQALLASFGCTSTTNR